MSKTLDYEMTAKALLKLQMNLVLKELKGRPRKLNCGSFSLMGMIRQANQEIYGAKKKGRDEFHKKYYHYAGRKWSLADMFQGKIMGKKFCKDKRCGFQGFAASIWSSRHNMSLQYYVKSRYNKFQEKQDWLGSQGRTFAQHYFHRLDLGLFMKKLILNYFGIERLMTISWNDAYDFMMKHYNEDWLNDQLWLGLHREGLYTENEWNEITKFIYSFGEGQVNDLTQSMGNDLYSKQQVKAMWSLQGNWGRDTMEDYLQETR